LTYERENTRDIIDNIIDSEIGYIFTNDYEYLANKIAEKERNLEKAVEKNPQ